MYLGFSFWTTIILIAILMGVIQGTCAYLILLERKIAAWTQDRLGPNRVGPWGLLQPIADGIKFVLKEQVIPSHVDRIFYLLGPAVAITTATLAIAVVPFGPTTPPPVLLDRRPDHALQPVWPQTKAEEEAVLDADRKYADAHRDQGAKTYEEQLAEYNNTLQFVIAPHVDIGVVFVFAVGSLAVYGIVLGGWSSNNKYSFLGSLRSSAQLISYEIPLGMSVLGVMLITGSLNLEKIIAYQYHQGWNVLFQPLACLLFVISIFAETNRLPFDLPEAEQELVGGYHTEYSGMKFALFFLGEYTHMITTSFLLVILFFGGWQLVPFVAWPGDTGVGSMILKVLIIAVKMALVIVFYMLVRWTIPRFRYDQLMGLTWKVLLPLALVNLVAVLCVKQFDMNHWWLLLISVVVFVGSAALSLRLPRAPSRNLQYVRVGHPIGQPTLVGDRVGLRR